MSLIHETRGDFEITANILRITVSDESKTHIMYRANLSYDTVKRYIDRLIHLKMIQRKVDGNREVFVTTEKGKLFLERFNELKKVIEEK